MREVTAQPKHRVTSSWHVRTVRLVDKCEPGNHEHEEGRHEYICNKPSRLPPREDCEVDGAVDLLRRGRQGVCFEDFHAVS
jgi:hypothetical protein